MTYQLPAIIPPARSRHRSTPTVVPPLTSSSRSTSATWVKRACRNTHGAPGVKQQLAAVRMLFDYLITGQVDADEPGRGRAPARSTS